MLRLYSGAGAGRLLQQKLLLGKELGIGHKLGIGWKTVEMLHPAEYAGLRGYVRVQPAKDTYSPIQVKQYYATAAQKRFNATLSNDRLSGACPLNLKPTKYKTCAPCNAAREKGGIICRYAIRRFGT